MMNSRMHPGYEKFLFTAESRKGVYRDLVKRLKRKAPAELEDEIHRLHEEAFARIDCLSCGNCCAHVGPRLTQLDTGRIAKALSMKRAEVEEHYLTMQVFFIFTKSRVFR
jgi:hypothetical protein